MTRRQLSHIARQWGIPKSTLNEYMDAPEEQKGVLMKEIKRLIALRLMGH